MKAITTKKDACTQLVKAIGEDMTVFADEAKKAVEEMSATLEGATEAQAIQLYDVLVQLKRTYADLAQMFSGKTISESLQELKN